MKRNIFIIILLIIMLCCSCCSYKETFVDHNENINLLNNILNKITETQNSASTFQQKILDKLDYVTEYKKLYNYNQDERIKQIDNITEAEDIRQELISLGLSILYKDEIVDLEQGNIDDLEKYKNTIKTKYLIDNEIISASINNKAYEEVEFNLPSPDPKYPKDTNDAYYNDKILPLVNQQLGSNPTNVLIEIKRTEIEATRSMHPDIYITDSNGDVDKNENNQIYLNDNFKRKFKQNVDEYNIEKENTDILKNKVKEDFESGFYLSDGTFNIKRDDYKQEFNIS